MEMRDGNEQKIVAPAGSEFAGGQIRRMRKEAIKLIEESDEFILLSLKKKENSKESMVATSSITSRNVPAFINGLMRHAVTVSME